MTTTVYQSGDYAGLSAKNAEFYYGYEVEDIHGNWCFTAKFNGDCIQIPSTRLGRDSFDVVGCLLHGIAIIFEEYELSEAKP